MHRCQQRLQVPPWKHHARAGTAQRHLWIEGNCSARFGSQVFPSIWFSGYKKKVFSLDFKIMANFRDMFGPLNFIAPLRPWPVACGGPGCRAHTLLVQVRAALLLPRHSLISHVLLLEGKGQLVLSLVAPPVATGLRNIEGRVCFFSLVPLAGRVCFPDQWNVEASLPSSSHGGIRQRAHEGQEGSCTTSLNSPGSCKAPCAERPHHHVQRGNDPVVEPC